VSALLSETGECRVFTMCTSYGFKPSRLPAGPSCMPFQRSRCPPQRIYVERLTIMYRVTKHRHGSSPSCLGPASCTGAKKPTSAGSIRQHTAFPRVPNCPVNRICKLRVKTDQEDRLCGLVIRVPGCRHRGPRCDSRRYQTFGEAIGL
jgi:hypothetical protein